MELVRSRGLLSIMPCTDFKPCSTHANKGSQANSKTGLSTSSLWHTNKGNAKDTVAIGLHVYQSILMLLGGTAGCGVSVGQPEKTGDCRSKHEFYDQCINLCLPEWQAKTRYEWCVQTVDHKRIDGVDKKAILTSCLDPGIKPFLFEGQKDFRIDSSIYGSLLADKLMARCLVCVCLFVLYQTFSIMFTPCSRGG